MKNSLLNGQYTNEISILDRGLAYGDGCFTTALVENGRVQMLEQHLVRLELQSAALALPTIDIKDVEKQIVKICQQSKQIKKTVLKVIVTSGEGGRGYSRQSCGQANVILTLHDFPEHYHQWQKTGINLGISEQQLGINPQLAGIKHLNRLEQVLLRSELDQRDEDDLIVTDIQGNIVECCSANVFWLKAGKWYTPDLSQAGVAGVMRQYILQTMPEVIQGHYTLSDIENVEAMFISNAILGIVAVKQFNLKALDLLKAQAIHHKLEENNLSVNPVKK